MAKVQSHFHFADRNIQAAVISLRRHCFEEGKNRIFLNKSSKAKKTSWLDHKQTNTQKITQKKKLMMCAWHHYMGILYKSKLLVCLAQQQLLIGAAKWREACSRAGGYFNRARGGRGRKPPPGAWLCYSGGGGVNKCLDNRAETPSHRPPPHPLPASLPLLSPSVCLWDNPGQSAAPEGLSHSAL